MARCIERSCRLEHNADHLAVGVEGTDIVAEGLVFAAMTFILVAVLEKVTMKLLNVVFGNRDVRPCPEDGFHHLGISGDLLLVASAEPLDLQVAEQAFHLPIGQFAALDAGG